MADRQVISGVGIVSPLGQALDSHMHGLATGAHGFRKIDVFATDGAAASVAGIIDTSKINVPNRKLHKLLSRKDLIGVAAAYEAITNAQLVNNDTPSDRRGAFIGSCSTQLGDFMPYFTPALRCVDHEKRTFSSDLFGAAALQDINPLAAVRVLLNGCLAQTTQLFDLQGTNANVMDGEVSGLKALLYASESLARGEIDWALVGAMSAPLDPFQMADAQSRGRLTGDIGTIKPFDADAGGTLLSEGAIFFVLESMASFARRLPHTKPFAFLEGCNESANQNLTGHAALRDCLAALPASMWAPSPPLVVSTNTGERQCDDYHAMQLAEALHQRNVAISNFVGLTGDLGEAAGLFALAQGIWSLRREQVSAVHGLTRKSATAGALDIATHNHATNSQSCISYSINQFGQCVSAAMSIS